jgi:predicted Na+-dependent transporter
VTIPGFKIGTPTLTVVAHQYPTAFGDLTAPPDSTYSRIVLAVPVTRDALPYLVKIMLPIVIVVLITSLIYMIPARLEDARTGIGVTAMLTMVALQWSTDADLPSVEYLMMVDVIYIVSMAYILIAMGYTVFASRRSTQESADAILQALDRRMGITSLVLYVVLIAIVVTWYLTHYKVGVS